MSAVKDPMKKKKARNMVRTKFEERYKSGKNRWVKCLMVWRVMRVLNIAKICEYEIILVFWLEMPQNRYVKSEMEPFSDMHFFRWFFQKLKFWALDPQLSLYGLVCWNEKGPSIWALILKPETPRAHMFQSSGVRPQNDQGNQLLWKAA